MAAPRQHSLLAPESVINSRYVVKELKIKGGFGQIYQGFDQIKNGNVAIKVEDKRKSDTLQNELYIYEQLHAIVGGNAGFPKLHYYTSDDRLRILVIDWLGQNMEERFEQNNFQFSPAAIATFMHQALQRLEFLHNKTNFIHGDIKPENFLLCKRNNQDHIVLVDFGLSTKFWNETTNKHVKYYNAEFSGTRLFAPINSHKHKVQSRRDDLEALGYVMAYFINKGWLPWLNSKKERLDKNRNRIDETLTLKQSTHATELCPGPGVPQQFLQYLKDVNVIKFAEKPNYVKLKKYFAEVIREKLYLPILKPAPLPLRTSSRLKNANRNLKRIRVESETSNNGNLAKLNNSKRHRL